MGDTATTQIRRAMLRMAERIRARAQEFGDPSVRRALEVVAHEFEAEAMGKRQKQKIPD